MTVSHPPQSSVAGVTRAGEWWQFKLVPALATAYATALLIDVSIVAMWQAILLLLVALGSGAAFVSLLNDATDLADDAAAGKANRLVGRSAVFIAGALVAPILLAFVIGWQWRANIALLGAYCGAWIAFAAYSLPPFRLKQRGAWGLIADAAGAHLFPALIAALSLFAAAGREPDLVWLGAIGIWAMACGMRGILWHQLADAANDRAAGVRTFVVHASPRAALQLAKYWVFPVECAALGVVLWRLGQPAPIAALAAYGVLIAGRIVYYQQRPVIAASPPRYVILLHEYYGVLMPVSLLIAAALHNGHDWLALCAHFALFPRAILSTATDIVRIAVRCVRGHRYR